MTPRITDADASATEAEWQSLGLRRGTLEELRPEHVVDVVIDEMFGLVDWEAGVYYLTRYHYARDWMAGMSITKLCAGVVIDAPVRPRQLGLWEVV